MRLRIMDRRRAEGEKSVGTAGASRLAAVEYRGRATAYEAHDVVVLHLSAWHFHAR